MRALARGSATITVTASDPDGLEASVSFPVTVSNGAPRIVDSIADIELQTGDETSVDASHHVADPDGDALVYSAESSDPGVAAADVSGSAVTVRALARGSAAITVAASDPEGLRAALHFEVTVVNGAPTATALLPDIELFPNESSSLTVSDYFRDPDGDALTYDASSSDPTVAEAAVSGATLRVRSGSVGSAQVTVRATDAPGLSTTQSFSVTVTPYVPPDGFNIQLVFDSSISASARQVIEGASAAWESILEHTELPNVRFGDTVTCGGLSTGHIDTVDGLLILFGATSIDGASGVLASAGPCYVRTRSYIPVVGRVFIDEADIDRLPAGTGLYDVALHEIAHVLGFGTLWSLRNPSEGAADPAAADTHFPGSNAVAAFNSAGGASYTGGKVPVENGGDDGHWRSSIFAGELMAPAISVSRTSPLSATTIQALADMGYSVSAGLADAFTITLPGAPSPFAAAEGDMVHLGDDIARLPIRVVDGEGRVVRVIRGSPR